MTGKAPLVSLVAPIYNGGPHYAACFESLCTLVYEPGQLEVIIVDDASTDGTREYLQNQTPPGHIRILYPETNLGRSAVRNFGLRQAKGEVIILLDGDMEVKPGFVQAHVAELSKPGRQAVLGEVKPADWLPRSRLNRYLYAYALRGAKQFDMEKPISFQYLLSHNLSLTRSALEGGSPFDESFVHYGGEDTLFAYQVARAFPNGLFYATAPTAKHHHHRTLRQHLHDFRSYGYHNLPRIIERHPELAIPLAADFAWPFPGLHFRRRRRMGLFLFNGLLYGLVRLLMPVTPPPLSNVAIRYLTVGAVVRGLRQSVRENRPAIESGAAGGDDHGKR